MKEITLAFIRQEIQKSIEALSEQANQVETRLRPMAESIAKLEGLKEQFPDLAAVFEAALQALRPKAEELNEDLLLLQASVKDLEEVKKKYDGSPEVHHLFIVFENGGKQMEISIDKNGKAKIEKIVDRAGNAAKIDGKPQWKIEGDDIAELVASEDGMECSLSAKGLLGSAKLFCEVDADLGEGMKLVKSNELDLQSVAGEASEVLIQEVLPEAPAEG